LQRENSKARDENGREIAEDAREVIKNPSKLK
jgi:hypothetical protein